MLGVAEAATPVAVPQQLLGVGRGERQAVGERRHGLEHAEPQRQVVGLLGLGLRQSVHRPLDHGVAGIDPVVARRQQQQREFAGAPVRAGRRAQMGQQGRSGGIERVAHVGLEVLLRPHRLRRSRHRRQQGGNGQRAGGADHVPTIGTGAPAANRPADARADDLRGTRRWRAPGVLAGCPPLPHASPPP